MANQKAERNRNVKCVLVDEETHFRQYAAGVFSSEELDTMWEQKSSALYWLAVIDAHKRERKLVGIEKTKAKALAKKVLKMAKEIKAAQNHISSLCYKYTYGTDGGILDSEEGDALKADINIKLALQVEIELPYVEEDTEREGSWT